MTGKPCASPPPCPVSALATPLQAHQGSVDFGCAPRRFRLTPPRHADTVVSSISAAPAEFDKEET